MLDENGMPMLLKLKDWPTDNDFSNFLPENFEDLMSVLPIKDYTLRTGHFNLASMMPDFFVRPDLGPKMYIAYGNALHPDTGTTNLHLDMSDAMNLMVHVGLPNDGDKNEHFSVGLKSCDLAGTDILTAKKLREDGKIPGAMWHIYHPRDADKIRDMLNKVSLENGQRLEPNTDPIHDQRVYLDTKLRKRLYEEYGVVGYAFPQCEGDVVFIPAGAPHQVILNATFLYYCVLS
jgi:lysine-specific demethylase 3